MFQKPALPAVRQEAEERRASEQYVKIDDGDEL